MQQLCKYDHHGSILWLYVRTCNTGCNYCINYSLQINYRKYCFDCCSEWGNILHLDGTFRIHNHRRTRKHFNYFQPQQWCSLFRKYLCAGFQCMW